METITLTRYEGNPILRPVPEHPFEAQNVSNAGAIVHDGKVHILYRAEGFQRRLHTAKTWPVTRLGLAISADGLHVDRRRPEAVIGPEPPGEYGEHGIQDPRISKIGEVYYIVTAAVSRWGDRVILYTTRDFERFEKVCVIQGEHEMRTAGLFPQMFGNDFCFLLRYLPNLWISYTPDFRRWHGTKCILRTRKHSWCGMKLGLGAPPIRQDDAWLLFWHGKNDTDGSYSLGVMWLDLDDPSKIIRVQEEPILTVERDYEREGYWPNVVYTCGAVERAGQYLVYYGCADRVLAVATVPVEACRAG